MKNSSTLFLRVAIIIIGIIALLFCIFAVPAMSNSVGAEFPSLMYLYYPMMLGAYAAAIPFFMILFQGWRLLNFIDNNTAFSSASVRALEYIKRSAIVIGCIYALSVPFFFYPAAELSDAPGAIFVGIFISVTPFVFAVFVTLLKKLLQNAIDLQTEVDLTV